MQPSSTESESKAVKLDYPVFSDPKELEKADGFLFGFEARYFEYICHVQLTKIFLNFQKIKLPKWT